MAYEIEDGISSAPALSGDVPCCGVLAVAMLAGVTFEAAWDAIKPHVRRRGSWQGSTYDWQRRKALEALGVKFVEERFYDKPMTVKTFVEWLAKPNTHYNVHVRGHVVHVFNGVVTDQAESLPAREHRSGRRKVTQVWQRVDV